MSIKQRKLRLLRYLDHKIRTCDKENLKQLATKALDMLKWLANKAKSLGKVAQVLFTPFKALTERWLNKVKGMKTDAAGQDGVIASKIKSLGERISNKINDPEFREKMKKFLIIVVTIAGIVAAVYAPTVYEIAKRANEQRKKGFANNFENAAFSQ